MTLTPDQIKEALSEPEIAAHLADLVYIQDEHLTIHRKKHGRGFTYLINNKDRVKDQAELKRIKSLVIPPGWNNVRISAVANGHLQSVGRDDKGRAARIAERAFHRDRKAGPFGLPAPRAQPAARDA